VDKGLLRLAQPGRVLVGHLAIQGEGRGIAQERSAVLGLEGHQHPPARPGPGPEPDHAARADAQQCPFAHREFPDPIFGQHLQPAFLHVERLEML
jgi:hypothetical protein